MPIALCGRIKGHLESMGRPLRGSRREKGEPKGIWREEESFNFLGYTVQAVKHPETGKVFALIRPSHKAMAWVKAEVKALTCRETLGLPAEGVMGKLNELVRGWVGYFYYGNCRRPLAKIKPFLEERVRIYLRRKHRPARKGYRSVKFLYGDLGLYKIPTTAPWTQTAKAAGRR